MLNKDRPAEEFPSKKIGKLYDSINQPLTIGNQNGPKNFIKSLNKVKTQKTSLVAINGHKSVSSFNFN